MSGGQRVRTAPATDDDPASDLPLCSPTTNPPRAQNAATASHPRFHFQLSTGALFICMGSLAPTYGYPTTLLAF